jgi:bleomycin hydrolase
MEQHITMERLNALSARFNEDKAAKAAMNAVVKNGITASATAFDLPRRINTACSVEVTETGDITNQKQSGRCWMFAALNAMRTTAMRKLNLESLEFSQAYPLFFDKLERSNYFLESIIQTLDEPLNGRLMQHLLSQPLGDGGQWDMFANLIKKYGAVPKDHMPESFHSSNTAAMNRFLTLKLRQFAKDLREAGTRDETALRAQKDGMIEEIYQMLCIFLGTPPTEVLFETRDKDKNFLRIGPVSPVEFFEQVVGWNLSDYVSLIHAPTADKPYYRTYTVDFLGNVVNGQEIRYLNVPIDELKAAVVAQLKDNLPVWFGCDVGQWLEREKGAMYLSGLDVSGVLGVDFPLTKAQRLDYGESRMTHAMVFYGVNLDASGKPDRFKVANSWGEDRGQKGWYMMEDAWFDEYLYQALIHKKYLTKKQLLALETEPIHLHPWDPMGALATIKDE